MTINITVEMIITIVASAAGAAGLVRFLLGKWIDKRTAECLAEQKSEIDTELEKLKSANARASHILTSLYDEEVLALKGIAVAMSKLYESCIETQSKAAKIASSVILRNEMDEEEALKEIYDLRNDTVIRIFSDFTITLYENSIFVGGVFHEEAKAFGEEFTDGVDKLFNDIIQMVKTNTITDIDNTILINETEERRKQIFRMMREHIANKKRDYMGD